MAACRWPPPACGGCSSTARLSPPCACPGSAAGRGSSCRGGPGPFRDFELGPVGVERSPPRNPVRIGLQLPDAKLPTFQPSAEACLIGFDIRPLKGNSLTPVVRRPLSMIPFFAMNKLSLVQYQVTVQGDSGRRSQFLPKKWTGTKDRAGACPALKAERRLSRKGCDFFDVGVDFA